MFTSGKPWWSWRLWPFSWPGRGGPSRRAGRLLARAALFIILIAPLWWAASCPYQHVLAFIANGTLNMGKPDTFAHKVVPRDHSFAVVTAEYGHPQMKFAVQGGLMHVGMVLMIALIAASPLDHKRLLKAVPICVGALVLYHVFYLDVAVRCPYSLFPRPFNPIQLHYLNMMGPKARAVLANLNIFNQTVGWQLAPLLIWGAAAWKRWA